jgi:hypothetical protein
MATPESKVKDKIKAGLEDVRQKFGPGLQWDMTVPCGMGTNGIPDFRGILRGRPWAIEAKAASGKMTKLQENWRTEFISAGGFYFLACPESQTKPHLDEIRHATCILLTWLGNDPNALYGRFITLEGVKGELGK